MRKIHAAVLSWAILACAGSDAATLKPYLAPFPGSVVTAVEPEIDIVAYEVEEPYPAERVLRFIRSRVPAEFRPLSESLLNPGIATSHVRGWTTSSADFSMQRPSTHEWHGEWEDARGNILVYTLSYPMSDDEGKAPTSTRLHVSGSLSSRAEIAAMREEMARMLAMIGSPPPPKPQPEPVANASYLILRPLQEESFAGAASADVNGQTFHFAKENILLDLGGFDLGSANMFLQPGGTYAVMMRTNPAGREKLKSWTAANAGRRVGFFVDGRLVAAASLPVVNGVIFGVFSKAEVEKLLERLKRGGAA